MASDRWPEEILLIFKNITFYEHLTYEVGILECVSFLSKEAQRADGTLIDFPHAFSEFSTCITQFCDDPFDPYVPVVRESTDKKKKAKKGREVPFMHNVVVHEAGAPVPIHKSSNGKLAIYGDPSPFLHPLRFQLLFSKSTSSTTTVSHSKDTFFDAIHPLPASRATTPTRADQVKYTEEQKRQEKEAIAELDADKARSSMLYKSVQIAEFPLLTRELREYYGKTMIESFKSKFYDKEMDWAGSFTVRALIFDPLLDAAKVVKHKENRKELCTLFHIDADEVERDIDELHKGFTTEVSQEKRKELEEAQTDIVLFHTALVGKSCYKTELAEMISRIITLPINSAGAERGFSIAGHFQSKRRTRMTVAHLDAYLFINQNGPTPHSFVTKSYVEKWLKRRHPTELLQPDEEGGEESTAHEEEVDEDPAWMRAFSDEKNVPRITIFD